MAKEVNLSSYWMPILRNLKEFKEIAKAEEPEIKALLEAVDRTLNNMFIETADEYGIKRFEEIMGIYPEADDDLETRRFSVSVKWSDKLPYTAEILDGLLETLCGKDGYRLKVDNGKYILTVKLALSNEDNVDEVRELLDRVAPANLITKITLFNTHAILNSLTYAQLNKFTHKEVREEIF